MVEPLGTSTLEDDTSPRCTILSTDEDRGGEEDVDVSTEAVILGPFVA